jgi:hypothetical protein
MRATTVDLLEHEYDRRTEASLRDPGTEPRSRVREFLREQRTIRPRRDVFWRHVSGPVTLCAISRSFSTVFQLRRAGTAFAAAAFSSSTAASPDPCRSAGGGRGPAESSHPPVATRRCRLRRAHGAAASEEHHVQLRPDASGTGCGRRPPSRVRCAEHDRDVEPRGVRDDALEPRRQVLRCGHRR